MNVNDDNKPLPWKKLGVSATVGAGAEILGTVVGVPGVGALAAVVTQGLIDWRWNRAEALVDSVAVDVGPDRLMGLIQTDEQLQNLFWEAIQAAAASAMQEKRIYLASVVSGAMNAEKRLPEAQMIVTALSELDVIHIEALARIVAADDENRADPGVHDEKLQDALDNEQPPVLAALVRTGLMLVGSQEVTPGLHSVPRARNYSISGVNEFGRKLLIDLQSVEPKNTQSR